MKLRQESREAREEIVVFRCSDGNIYRRIGVRSKGSSCPANVSEILRIAALHTHHRRLDDQASDVLLSQCSLMRIQALGICHPERWRGSL
jgi:hypothetical protein